MYHFYFSSYLKVLVFELEKGGGVASGKKLRTFSSNVHLIIKSGVDLSRPILLRHKNTPAPLPRICIYTPPRSMKPRKNYGTKKMYSKQTVEMSSCLRLVFLPASGVFIACSAFDERGYWLEYGPSPWGHQPGNRHVQSHERLEIRWTLNCCCAMKDPGNIMVDVLTWLEFTLMYW
jgi:hypothetical protein